MKLYKYESLTKDAKDKAFDVYQCDKADRAYESEIPEAVEGMESFMDSISEYSSLPDWGGVYLKCGFGSRDFDDIDFDVRADNESWNTYEWELANLFNARMDENMGLFGIARKIDDWYWDWYLDSDCDAEGFYETYGWFSDLQERVTKRAAAKYTSILEEVANLMEGLAEGFEGEYYERSGHFECDEAPSRRYHEDGSPWTVRQLKAA